MRIVYVCADRGIPLLGGKGASVHCRAITGALSRIGHEVTVAVARLGSGAPLPIGPRLVLLPDDMSKQREELAGLIAGADLVVERHSLNSGAARAASRAAGVPFVIEVNAQLVAEAARFRGLTDVEAWTEWERLTWADADAVVAVSGPLCRAIEVAAPEARVQLLRNGVGLFPGIQRSTARSAHRLRDEDVAVVFVGSMKPWHGVMELLDCLPLLRSPIVLLMAGEGPLEAQVRQRASEMGERVRFLGPLPHDQVPTLLRAADIGVAPYLPLPAFYFSPLKVLEYLAAGLPVVYSREGDIDELVGQAGVGVPGGDIAALARALESLASDGTRRAALADLAASRVEGGSWEDVARRLVEFAGSRESVA